MNDAQFHPSNMQISPIGEVRSPIKLPMPPAPQSDADPAVRNEQIRAYRHKVKTNVCDLVIYPSWEELLDGIESFSHILVLYWPHLINPAGRNLRKVHPMGRHDLPLQGIFATCSPARPNPVLVSVVSLLARAGSILKVQGLDAVDGSPVIDIKPYTQFYGSADNVTVPEWMIRLHEELGVNLVKKMEQQQC